MLFLATAFVLATLDPLAQGRKQQAPAPDQEEPSRFIYYDYIENGELRGGRVEVEPGNPLHEDSGFQQRSGASSPVTTLLFNGNPANRIDLVFVGDGYTASQLGTYANDVNAVWPAFLAEPPLSNYATYFNVHRVDVTSVQSGVDNDPSQGIQKQTALDMTYWCSGIQRLLCVDVNKAFFQAVAAPDVDTILALANSGTYGGAGYNILGTLAGHNGAAIEIALHEFGHSFAQLADEYDYGGPANYTGAEPVEKNVSIYNEAQIQAMVHKWVLWLDLPNVSAFEGAMYSQFGIYRPTFDSKMRSLNRPYEEFNSERFIRYIYGVVRPIDAATPSGTYALDADFFVDPVDPVTHALDVQWSLDGNPIPGATGTNFDAGSLLLSDGQHTISVKVVDNTTMVRAQALRANWMTEERSWTLDGQSVGGGKARAHGGPAPVLDVVISLPGGRTLGGELEFQIEAAPGTVQSGALPLLFVSTAPVGTNERLGLDLGRGLLVRRVGEPWAGPGQPASVRVALPRVPALVDRALYARGAFFDPAAPSGRRLVWTRALEFYLED